MTCTSIPLVSSKNHYDRCSMVEVFELLPPDWHMRMDCGEEAFYAKRIKVMQDEEALDRLTSRIVEVR